MGIGVDTQINRNTNIIETHEFLKTCFLDENFDCRDQLKLANQNILPKNGHYIFDMVLSYVLSGLCNRIGFHVK